jgi:hypothetical protein
MKKKALLIGAVTAGALLVGGWALAQSNSRGPGFGAPFAHDHGPAGMRAPGTMQQMGRGMMGMGPGMMGMNHGSATMAEHNDIRALLFNHDRIKRTVANLPDSIRTVTESDDPQVAEVIRKHVVEMGRRVEEGRDPGLPIESPALHSIFRDKDKIKSTYETTAKGIIVVQTSTDLQVVTALQEHAAEVSDLARRGMVAMHEAMMKNGGGMRHGPMRSPGAR